MKIFISSFFQGIGGAELNDRLSTQTDSYLMSSDGRRRKNLGGDNSIYMDKPVDPIGDLGNIFRTAIASSVAITISPFNLIFAPLVAMLVLIT
jgi:hypothetical protein